MPTACIGFHHLAFVTTDSAATVRFYEDVLGMPLVHAVLDDKVPSAGVTDSPFLHTFFDMGANTYVGFIEIDGLPPERRDDRIPDWPRHIAIQLKSLTALEEKREQLLAKGVEVTAIHGHADRIRSIYIHDPNGIRVEFCVASMEYPHESNPSAHELVDKVASTFRHPVAS